MTRRSAGPWGWMSVCWAVVGMILLSCGCSGLSYHEKMREIARDYYLGNPQGALARVNATLEDAGDDRPLFLLERAMIHQRMGRYKEAQNDLIAADENLEVLDFTDDTSENVAEYTLSPSLSLYRGQPHEKILVNTLNIMNFLAEGDLSTARIAARRAGEMYRYQVEEEDRFHYKNALTMLLYGLTFEISGKPNEAYLAYRNAYELSEAPFLRSRLIHLAREIRHSDLARWEKEFGELPPPVPEGHGTVLILVLNGRTPIRQEREIAVPTPLLSYSHEGVTFSDLGQNTIRYPELVKQSHRFHLGRVHFNGGPAIDLVRAIDVETQALNRFEEEKPRIIAACVTRFLIRAVAAGAVTGAVEHQVEKDTDKEMDEGLKDLLNFFVQAALAELDQPDLRCWSLLPAEILVSVAALPPGQHSVSLEMLGRQAALNEEATVSVLSGGLSLMLFSVTD